VRVGALGAAQVKKVKEDRREHREQREQTWRQLGAERTAGMSSSEYVPSALRSSARFMNFGLRLRPPPPPAALPPPPPAAPLLLPPSGGVAAPSADEVTVLSGVCNTLGAERSTHSVAHLQSAATTPRATDSSSIGTAARDIEPVPRIAACWKRSCEQARLC